MALPFKDMYLKKPLTIVVIKISVFIFEIEPKSTVLRIHTVFICKMTKHNYNSLTAREKVIYTSLSLTETLLTVFLS